MGWERRMRGGLYYTRSKKVAGRVVREYIGGGVIGQLAAGGDAEHRAQLKAQAESWRAERAQIESTDEPLQMFCEASDALVRRTLTLAGYYQHNRGEWRKRRGKSDCPSE